MSAWAAGSTLAAAPLIASTTNGALNVGKYAAVKKSNGDNFNTWDAIFEGGSRVHYNLGRCSRI